MNLGKSNTYEFKFKRKKIVLKPVKPKLNVGNTKEGIVIDKNNKTPWYLMTRSHFSLESPIDGCTLRFRNFLDFLPLLLGVSPIITVEPPALYLHELHDHNIRKITFNNYNY